MIKKPKRQLKVKSIFDDQTNTDRNNSNPEQIIVNNSKDSSTILKQVETQSISQNIEHPKLSHVRQSHNIPKLLQHNKHHQTLQPMIQQQIVSQHVISKVNNFQQIPQILINKQQTQIHLTDVKRNKIQELKQKYLKKTAHIIQEITIIQPKYEDIDNNINCHTNLEKYEQTIQTLQTTAQCVQELLPEIENNYFNVETNFVENNSANFTSTVEQIQIKSIRVPVRRCPPTIRSSQFKINQNKLQSFNLLTEQQNQNVLNISQNQKNNFQTTLLISNSISQSHKNFESNSNFPFNLNYSNYLKNPQYFLQQLHSTNLISQLVVQLLQTKIYNQTTTTREVQLTVNHPEFNYWVSRLFYNQFVKSLTISQSNESLANQMLNQFIINSNGPYSPVFVIVLSKLSHQYYSKYQQYILSYPHFFVNMLAQYQSYVDKNKLTQFLSFVQKILNPNMQNICQLLLVMFLTSPETINDCSLHLFTSKCNFAEAAVVLIILGKLNRKFVRYNIEISNVVLKQLQQKNQIQTGLELIKLLIGELGTQSYPLLKQKRQRLIRGCSNMFLQEQQNDPLNQVKNVTSNIFGFFSNAVDKIINKPQIEERFKPQPPPQKKQSIYFDPVKKRYILNGEIPEDQEQVIVQIQKQTPPTSQIRNAFPLPSSIPKGNNGSRRQNRMPANRYV